VRLRVQPDDVLDAALTCIARVGSQKTTLDDVARAAGCSRATVYRFFPGKQQLVGALVARDAARLGDALIDRAATETELAGAVAIIMYEGARGLREHAALTFVAMHEPEVLLPCLAFERESLLLRAAAQLIAPAFTRFVDHERAQRLAEWTARVTLSHLSCPSEYVDFADVAQVRALVDEFVIPSFNVSRSGRSS
jgi:AcrR family transcriptional regulator